jgi:hypothetical protein
MALKYEAIIMIGTYVIAAKTVYLHGAIIDGK